MKWKLVAGTALTAVVLIAGGVLVGTLTQQVAQHDPVRTAPPVSVTGPSTSPTTAPVPTPAPSDECITSYGDAGPPATPDPITGCLPALDIFTPTAEQIAGVGRVGDFVRVFATFDSSESVESRSNRLAPYVKSGSTVLAQASKVSREDSGLVGLTGTASIPNPVSTIINHIDGDGNWVYTVGGTFVGHYEQGSQVSNWRGSGTWTVTVTAAAPHLVIAVSEDIPSLDGA